MTDIKVHNWSRFLVDAVQSYAKKNNIKFELFSGDWIMRLEAKASSKPGTPRACPNDSEGTTRYLFGNDFGLNNTAARAICNDKSACYQVLTRESVPALEHRILLRPETLGAPKDTFKIANESFVDFNKKAIIKPNSGSSGSDIILVRSGAMLERVLDNFFIRYRALTISPYVLISAEYRVNVLNDSVELMYEKVRQSDSLQHNLSHGAQAQDITDEHLAKRLSNMAQDAAKAINATFVHVDIIDISGKLMVLEVNSGIMFEHYAEQSNTNKKRSTDIYHKALDLLFL